jgi:hypothetical protein
MHGWIEKSPKGSQTRSARLVRMFLSAIIHLPNLLIGSQFGVRQRGR